MKKKMTRYHHVYRDANDSSKKIRKPEDGEKGYALFGNNSWISAEFVRGTGWLSEYDAKRVREKRASEISA
jgi:hypothetical protein